MTSPNGDQLIHVVKMVDQAIGATVELLTSHTDNLDQLMLNVTREQALRMLQELLTAEYRSLDSDDAAFWRIVSSILATIVTYILETLGKVNPYQYSCEQSQMVIAHGSYQYLKGEYSYEDRGSD